MEAHDDPLIMRQRVSRRQALSLLGATAVLFGNRSAPAQQRPACVALPQQTEGPYFVDTKLARSDIRSDSASGAVRPGMPLVVTFVVSRMHDAGCTPLENAHVELWQCDARGLYSGVRDPALDTSGQNFLRGYQTTDASGMTRFTTIYPGWYPGRTVHLHFMIRSGEQPRREVFTSQLYFDDALSDRIHSAAPYNERGPRTVRNGGDGIFRRGGTQLLLPVRVTDDMLEGTFHVGLDGRAN